MIKLSDIDPHWYYNRHTAGLVTPQGERRILLNPAVVKGKGRPKGSTTTLGLNSKKARYGVSRTRRDPSLFKHEAFELLSSTTPACIKGEASKKPRGRPRKTLLGATLVTPRESIDLTTNTPILASLSTTTMAVLCGAKSK